MSDGPTHFERLCELAVLHPRYVTSPVTPYRLASDHGGAFQHYGDDLFAEVELYAQKIGRACQDHDYDVVHAHDWLTFLAGIAIAEARGLPLIAHFHSLEIDRSPDHPDAAIRAIEALAVARADRVVAVSRTTAELLAREYGLPPGKRAVVYNGTDTFAGVARARRASVANSKNVLFLGRLTKQKGVHHLCDIASRVLSRAPNTRFVIVGDGYLRQPLAQAVRERGLEDHVRLIGKLEGERVRAAYAAADVFIMPSVAEPFGLVATEAIEQGVPVVLSPGAGACEIVPSAFKADPTDPERFANLISVLLHHPEIGRDMVERARAEMRRHTWRAAARQLSRLYLEARA